MSRTDSFFYPPRLMSVDEAARYVGLGRTKFLDMIDAGIFPRPKNVGGKTLWDRIALDTCASDMPDAPRANRIDAAISAAHSSNVSN